MMVSHGKLHHIEIYVSDLSQSKVFWQWLLTEKFQYSIFQNWDQGITFKHGQTYLVFVQTEKEFKQHEYHRKNIGLNHLAFYANSSLWMDELREELIQRGIQLLYDDRYPNAGGNDTYALYFEDPDRIKVEIVLEKKGE